MSAATASSEVDYEKAASKCPRRIKDLLFAEIRANPPALVNLQTLLDALMEKLESAKERLLADAELKESLDILTTRPGKTKLDAKTILESFLSILKLQYDRGLADTHVHAAIIELAKNLIVSAALSDIRQRKDEAAADEKKDNPTPTNN